MIMLISIVTYRHLTKVNIELKEDTFFTRIKIPSRHLRNTAMNFNFVAKSTEF